MPKIISVKFEIESMYPDDRTLAIVVSHLYCYLRNNNIDGICATGVLGNIITINKNGEVLDEEE